MKKQILMFLLLAMLAAGGTAREVTGKVFCDKEGLEGVVVTDGTRFTTTDKDGIYRLDAVDDADFIYIVTPSGYVASYASGTPRFYHTPSEKSLDFELFRFSAPKGSYALFAVGDTQPGSEHAYQRLEAEAFPELQKHGNEYIDLSIRSLATTTIPRFTATIIRASRHTDFTLALPIMLSTWALTITLCLTTSSIKAVGNTMK